ncbi:hypothetical protein KCM76_25260 [Zooshikella marina]|uniref:hypothetical protein n=1 Tax=Zooshikella ganghwensis TaxID=202772 RepID=UPI001BAE7DAC|nr:hypothetical protein [Zooshikella ganghwensis]MBU2709329.1 hypothetical protein [Zooshikella ganghwensis]
MMDKQQSEVQCSIQLMPSWTEVIKGEMITNPDPLLGGIIDRQIVSREWFIVFNNDEISTKIGFKSLIEAIRAFEKTIPKAKILIN